jgi:hypothetical protein
MAHGFFFNSLDKIEIKHDMNVSCDNPLWCLHVGRKFKMTGQDQ